MLFVELPVEILINIFDFVLSNKFNILNLRLLNKYILNVVKRFLKIKRSEKEKFNFILSERNIKYPKKLKLITINKHFNEEIIRPINYELDSELKIEKLGEKLKISSDIFNCRYIIDYQLKFKNFEFIDYCNNKIPKLCF